MSTSLPDAAARWQAITTPDHAFVWASAGTGKTHTLALRALYLLLNAPFLSPSEGEAGSLTPEIGSLYSASSRQERLKAARAIIGSLILTTFTRKAAAEMQTRLYRYLESVTAAESLSHLEATYAGSQGKVKDPLFYKILKTVLENLKSGSAGQDRSLLAGLDEEEFFQRLRAGAQALSEQAAQLQISTIHSFAASILRRHPLQAGIPPTARFARDDEEDLVGVEDQVLDRWWQQKVLADPQLQKELAQLLQVVPVKHIREWLKSSYQSRWLADESAALPLKNEKEMQEWVDAGFALVRALAAGGGSKIEENRDRLDQVLQDITSGQKGAFRELCDFIWQVKGDFFLDRKITNAVRDAIQALPPEHSRHFQSWTDFYVPAVRHCVATEFGEIWTVWTLFLGRFADWAEGAAMRELGLITFDEMIRLAVKLLEEHPSIRRAEQAKLRALLVDEFQDTDPDQLRLFKALLKREPNDPHEVLGFFVGDTKQSIYRFRNADVPSIEDFYHHYKRYTGCQLKQSEFRLKTSFRSVKSVTQFVNHFFEKVLTLTNEDIDEALVPFRSDEGVLPEWIFMDQDSEGRDFNVEQERKYAAAQALHVIQDYLERSDAATPPYKDILVLVKKWREVDALLPVLQKAGIPVISSGAKIFYRQPEVLDLLNLLIALLHPQDRLAVAVVLRSPLVYLSDPQLHDLLKKIPPERLFHSQEPLPDFLPREVQTRIEHLRKLAEGRLKKTLSEWLTEVRAFIPTALYSEPGDREGRPLVRIGRVLENFQEAMEMTVIPPLVWLLKQRDRAAATDQWDGNPGEDITVASENVDAVRVMTIHKAKGLEGRFTIIYGWSAILSDLVGSTGNRNPAEVLSLTTEAGEKVQAFSLQWGPLKIVSSSYPEALEQERKGNQAEAQRLAYVAATRARDRMVLLCPRSKHRSFSEEITDFISSAKSKIPADSQGGQVEICNGTLRFIDQPGVEITPQKAHSASLNLQEDLYQSLWRKRYSEFKSPLPPLLHHPSDPEHQEGEIREDHHYPGKADRETGLLVGRLVHTYLERYLLDDAFEPEKLSFSFSGIPELHSDNNVSEAAEKVLKQFYAGDLGDPSGQPYRERVSAARILGREVPVYLRDEGQAWHGIIDLILEEEGVIRAIDYKTTVAQDPLPETYAQQQRIYNEALRRLFPDQDVAFEFWWLK